MQDRFNSLSQEIEQLTQKVNLKSKAKWGVMNVVEMMNHIAAGLDLSLSYKELEITTPPEKLESYRRFLMSDKGFGESAPKPKAYLEFEPQENNDLEKAKAYFIERFWAFDNETKNNSNYWSDHPSFGRLNAEETRQLHNKHIQHHFKQFGILDQ